MPTASRPEPIAVRRWRAASLVVVAALFAGVTEQWAVACGVAALIVAALGLGQRLALGRTAARVASAVAAVVGAVTAAALPIHALRAPWPSFALAGLLAGAALLCRRDLGRGSAITLLPGLAALTACGEAPLGRVYGVVVVAFLVFALLALRASAIAVATGATRRARIASLAAVLVLATVVATGFMFTLPPLAVWSEGRILSALGAPEVGFSDRMALGSLHGMLQSDEIVLRVDGARTDYLRGAVFDHYEIGRWGRRQRAVLTPLPTITEAPSSARTRITVVSGARDRFFAPLGARAVATEPSATIDGYGILRTSDASSVLSFDAPEPDRAPAVAAPSADDLEIPIGLLPQLERIALVWTAGAATAEDKVAAIATRLRRDFTYSLEFDHQRRRDPLFDFLLDDHRGHCEYFASALTLLARAVGVPARVAIGYRVAEENPLGGYWIVRERNAHAWSEVFLEGKGFVTVDATPEGAVTANEPHREAFAGALWDLAGAGVSAVVRAFTVLRVAAALGVALVVLLAIRSRGTLRSLRFGRRRRVSDDQAPPSLARLLAACASKGVERPAWEPIERFADRLESLAGSGPFEGDERAGVADLLRRYAALRYGGVGSADELGAEMEAAASRLGR